LVILYGPSWEEWAGQRAHFLPVGTGLAGRPCRSLLVVGTLLDWAATGRNRRILPHPYTYHYHYLFLILAVTKHHPLFTIE